MWINQKHYSENVFLYMIHILRYLCYGYEIWCLAFLSKQGSRVTTAQRKQAHDTLVHIYTQETKHLRDEVLDTASGAAV